MPRDSSGNYTLPAGNPVVGGTVISATWANPTMSDIAFALTHSLSRDGEGGMLAPFKFADGTLGAPGMSWNSEPTSGFFRAGGNDMQAVIAGVPRMRWTASSVDVWDTGASAWLPIIGPLGSNFALTNSPNVFTALSTNEFNANTLFKASGTLKASAAVTLNSTLPLIYFYDSDAAADRKGMRLYNSNGNAVWDWISDSEAVSRPIMAVVLNNGVITMSYGNATDNTAHNFLGTGAATFGGGVTYAGQIVGNGAGGSGSIRLSSVSPSVVWTETDAPADTQSWRMRVNGNALTLSSTNDAFSAQSDILIATRTLVAVTQIRFGSVADNPSYQFLGTGAISFGGAASFAGVVTFAGVLRAPDGSAGAPAFSFSAETNLGIYRSAAGAMNFVSGAVDKVSITGQGLGITDGLVGTPALYFFFDPNTGLFRDTADSIAFAAGGVSSLIVRTSAVIVTAPRLLLPDGGASGPAASFLGDQDTGLYAAAGNRIGFSTGGVSRALLDNAFFETTVPIGVPSGTNGAPAFYFSVDPDTGMYRPGADSIAWAVGGVARLSLAASGVLTGIVADNTLNMELRATSHLMRLYADSGGTSFIQTLNIAGAAFTPLAISASTTTFDQGGVSAPSFTTISARDKKRVTGAPRKAWEILSRLRPILYRMLLGDDREQLGLIAEEVAEVCPQLSDGKTVAYDRLALLLLAAWQDERSPIHEG
jgi:hypothetical protein